MGLTLPDGGIKQIDFLKSIAGLDTASIEARAVDLELANGAHIRVLHPLDVLESRLRNLDLLPSKQNPVGRAQMKLAVGVMAKFLGIEPTRAALPSLGNRRFAAIADAKCD